MTCWLALDYAAALHAVEQIVLAGAEPVDAWGIAAWFCSHNNRSVIHVRTALERMWLDVTGQMIG